MDRIRIIALCFAVLLLGGAIWHYRTLRADLSAALASNVSLVAANQSNLVAIDALIADREITRKVLQSAAQDRARAEKAIIQIRKDIENVQADPVCLAADDRDRALARGLRDMFADNPD